MSSLSFMIIIFFYFFLSSLSLSVVAQRDALFLRNCFINTLHEVRFMKGIPPNAWLSLFALSRVHCISLLFLLHFWYFNLYLGFWFTFLDVFWTLGFVI